MQHLQHLIVQDIHLERPPRATTLSVTAICILLGVEHILANTIQHLILVRRLEACEGLQDFHLLLNDQLVHHS